MTKNLSRREISIFTLLWLVITAGGLCKTVKAQQWTNPDANGNISNANTGNVGIGTTSPQAMLHVVRPSRNSVAVSSRGINQDVVNQECDGTHLCNYWGTDFTNAGNMFFGFDTTNKNQLVINSSGNVGIGTTSPGRQLTILGNPGAGAAQGLSITHTGTGGRTYSLLTTDNTHGFGGGKLLIYDEIATAVRMTFDNSGNVGIGTTSPGQRLTVAGTIESTSGGFKFPDGTIQTTAASGGGGSSQWLGSPNIYYNSGNVGIGTSAPTSKIHVVGDGNVTGDLTVGGNINAKYQDVAEWVPSTEKLQAGTVVVLDPTKSNQVISSSQAYDTRVAGVISAQPGITLGEGGEGKVLVASTGRVKVKVDASRASIQIGDLLVTSDVPGVAMKSEAVNLSGVQLHRPGTLIGKALEPLTKGSGEILVLLSLQ